ncbi:TPA: DUF7507 domain-containing protein [Legionella anisa]
MHNIKMGIWLKWFLLPSKRNNIFLFIKLSIFLGMASAQIGFTASSLSLTKSASPNNYTNLGQVITYSYAVTNTGTDTISNVVINDAHSGLSTITCPLTTLTTTAPNNTTTCTATYTINQQDIDTRTVQNTATATGENPLSQQVTSNNSNVTINGPAPSPSLNLVKSSSATTFTTDGEVIPYSYQVTNTGNVTLTALAIADNKIPAPISCLQTVIAPGASTTCSGNYTVKLSDLDAGFIRNTASASARSPTNVAVNSNTEILNINATLNPALTIAKSSTTTNFSAPGTRITYSYLITNTGNNTVKTIVVADNKIPAPISCAATTLSPGDTTTCTGIYTTTQADVDADGVTNIGSVTGVDNQGTSAASSPTPPYLIPAVQNPSIDMSKSTTTVSYDTAGDTISYSFAVTNTGNQTLSSVAITDPIITGPITCASTTLAPNATTTCTAIYTTTQADVDAGSVTNNAMATAQNQEGTQSVQSDVSSVTVYAIQDSTLNLVKSSSTPPFSAPGATVQYSYLITNEGNTTLNTLLITDNKIPSMNISCPATTLAPGASTTCTASYTTTQADIDAGGVTNTAQATAVDADGLSFKSAADTVTVGAIQNPVINMVKSTTATDFNSPNEFLDYTYTVTNNGNDTLYNITINDNKITSNLINCQARTLAPGASTTCTASYETTQADVDAGGITNNATAAGTNGVGTTVNSSPTQTTTIPAVESPALTLVKATATPNFDSAGEVLSYSYLVKNTGNVTISFLTVNDDKTTVTCGSTVLAPDTSTNCTATYTTTQADVNAGGIVNLANAIGLTPQGNTVTSPDTSNSQISVSATRSQGVSLAKSASPTSYTTAGTLITYSYVVTNTGNVTLNPITVNDDRLGSVTCPVIILDPGLSTTCTATYTTTASDVSAGSISNVGTVSGTSPIGTTQANSSLTVQGPQLPDLTIMKASNVGGFSAAGSVITYFYTVKNTGNVPLTSITVTDPHSGLSAISCPVTTLNPGAQTTCSATYVTTAADVANGSISDTATVTGNSPGGPATATSNTLVIPVGGGGLASIALTKSANTTSYTATGTVITYSYVVTNTGTVTYVFTLTDDRLGTITCPVTTLTGGQSTTCTQTYTTTQADIDAGNIANTAIAAGPNFVAISSLNINAIQSPSLTLTKDTTSPNFTGANQNLTYNYVLTNTGNLTLTNLVLSDNLISSSNLFCPSTSIAPGASITCQGHYITTQADVDNGGVTNTAFAQVQQLPAVVTTTKTVNAVVTPVISVTKSTSTPNYNAPNQQLTYSYLVKNLGNATLSGITLADTKIPSPITCVATSLAPNASTVCTGQYITTQADVDAGVVVNTATVSAEDQLGTVVTNSSSVNIFAQLTPKLSLTKTTTSPPFNAPGATISYTYTVKNTGNTTLSALGIDDNKIPAGITCLVNVLAPNATTTCSGTYTTTQADVDGAGITNSATVLGRTPKGSWVRSPTASTTVPAILNPSISLVKSSTTANYNAPNVKINYSYLVRNTGNDTLSNISINDDKFASSSQINCAATRLAPGATTTCTSIYTTTQADVDNGEVVNTATAAAQNPQGTAVTSPQSSVTVPAILTPRITMKKSTTATSFNAAGISIPYSYQVTNTGNDTLKNLTITDNKLTSGITCSMTILPRGMSTTCTGVYVTTQADVDAGVLTNTAFATAQNNQGTVVNSPNSSVTLIPVRSPAISLQKTSTTANYDAPGQSINYNYLVKNVGNDTLSSITITDNKIASANIQCPVTTLAPNASTTCTATYSSTLADIDAGSITNTARATGRNTQNVSVTSPVSSASVPAVLSPAIALVKSSTTTTFNAAGQVIPYRFQVTNTGNNTLRSIAISDSKIPSASIQCPVTTLAPNATTTCTANYTVKQTDIDAGSITNTATTSGRSNQGTVVVSPPSTVTINAIQLPAITLVKSTTTLNYTAAGQNINYRYRVTNTGNGTLSNIVVADDKVTSGIICPVTTLAPNSFTICTGVYTTTQADVDNGSVTNQATASGTNTQGTTVTSPLSTVTVTAISSPMLGVNKSTTTTNFNSPGITIPYNFVVTNNGNETITDIVIDDSKISSAISCAVTTLAPTESTTCTGSYTTTQTDVDDGEVVNFATAQGKDPGGDTVTSPIASVVVPAVTMPALNINKSTTTTSYANVGDTIPYDYVVTNTGNQTLNSLSINDSKISSGITCVATVLAPGATTTCSGSYIVTLADIDAGTLTNNATASGQNNQGTVVTSPPSTVTINAVQNPALSLVKSSTTANYAAVGDVISYEYQVMNTGNNTVSSITISDSKITSTITCPQTALAPNEWTVCTGSYTVTQADIDAGSITNIAHVAGTDPVGTSVLSPDSTVTIDAVLMPALNLVKSTTTSSYSAPADTITYSYLVTNTGNDTLSNIAIIDSKITSGITCPVTSLAPNGTTTCTGTYTVTQSDIDAGSVTNLAAATGVNGQGTPVTSPYSSVTVNAVLSPSITLVKSSTTASYNSAGDSINYQYLVTNTGNNTLMNVSINDTKIPTNISCPNTTLAPAQSTTCTGSYITTQADVDNGSVSNMAIASGQDINGVVTSTPSTVTVNAILTPALSLMKSSTTPNYNAPGNVISYTYRVTNTGNETISNIAITDSKIAAGINCTITTLAPQQFTNCTGSYTVTQADVNAGSLTNIATAEGESFQGTDVKSQPSTVTINAILTPALTLTKSSGTTSYSEPGVTINYQYLVTNTGNTTVTNIAISDTKISSISCPATPLDPGVSVTCTASYVTTQTDVDAGSIMNMAFASGTTPQSSTVNSPNTEFNIPATLMDALTLVKSTTATSFDGPGQGIPYTYVVTNTGNVTLYNLHIIDDKLTTGISCPQTTLAPNATTTCSGVYSTTQDDVDAGMVTNLANARAQTTLGVQVISPQGTTTVNALLNSGLNLVKSTQAPSFSVPGQEITYNYTVRNTGNETILGLTISDDHLPTGITCPATTLAPNNSIQCQGVYRVTQADIDANTITNVATASGTTNLGVVVNSNQATVTLSFVPGGGTISLVKTADVTSFSLPGTVINYSYLITNKGVTELHGLVLTDSILGTITCPVTTLLPGASTTCKASYVTTLADSQQGNITNIGIVTAITPNGLTVTGQASATVTFDAEYIRKKTLSAIRNFIKDRLQLVLSSEPDRRRIINRLTQRGDTCSHAPHGALQPMGESEGARFNAAMSLSDFCVEPYKFDIWSEAHASYYRQNTLDYVRHGEFFVGYLGVDYLINSSILAGILTEADTINRNGEKNNLLQAFGQGWMVGPYLSARLAPDVYLHTRAAWGSSGNRLNTFGYYDDHFNTNRSLYNAELVGDWMHKRLRISPTLGLSYYNEQQRAFTNFLHVYIPSQNISLGQVNFGPEVAYLIDFESARTVNLRLSLQGLYNFDYKNEFLLEDEVSSIIPFTGRVKLGAEVRFNSGVSVTPMVLYDGIGNQAFNSIQAQIQVNVPIS